MNGALSLFAAQFVLGFVYQPLIVLPLFTCRVLAELPEDAQLIRAAPTFDDLPVTEAGDLHAPNFDGPLGRLVRPRIRPGGCP